MFQGVSEAAHLAVYLWADCVAEFDDDRHIAGREEKGLFVHVPILAEYSGEWKDFHICGFEFALERRCHFDRAGSVAMEAEAVGLHINLLAGDGGRLAFGYHAEAALDDFRRVVDDRAGL